MRLSNRPIREVDVARVIDSVISGKDPGLIWCDSLQEWLDLPKIGCHILPVEFMWDISPTSCLWAEAGRHSYYAGYRFPTPQLSVIKATLERHGFYEWPQPPALRGTFYIPYKTTPPPDDLYVDHFDKMIWDGLILW